jgi:hypothetical protein
MSGLDYVQELHNKSKKLKEIQFKDRAELFDWMENNGRTNASSNSHWHKLQYRSKIGFNAVTERLYVAGSENTYSDKDADWNPNEFFVIERFDGYKLAYDAWSFKSFILEIANRFYKGETSACLDYPVNARGEIVLDKWGGRWGMNIIIEDNKMAKRIHSPRIMDVINYINDSRREDFKGVIKNRNVHIIDRETNMLKKDFYNLIVKLRMLGIPFMAVDLNTIAVLDNDGCTISLYTRQKEIYYQGEYNRYHG